MTTLPFGHCLSLLFARRMQVMDGFFEACTQQAGQYYVIHFTLVKSIAAYCIILLSAELPFSIRIIYQWFKKFENYMETSLA